MKNNPYFRHDFYAFDDPKVIGLMIEFGSSVGYAVFFKLLETMCRTEEHCIKLSDAKTLSFTYRESEALISNLIQHCLDKGLFTQEGERIYSPRLMEFFDLMQSKSDIGRISANKRWQANANPLGNHDHNRATILPQPCHNSEKQEPKVKTDYQDLLDYWNSKKIVKHDRVTPDIKQQIDRRIREKYTVEQIKLSIDNYANAVTVDEFWASRKTSWTFTLFLKQVNAFPVFLTWEKKIAPSGEVETGETEAEKKKRRDEHRKSELARVTAGLK
jgi:hypothetical protein